MQCSPPPAGLTIKSELQLPNCPLVCIPRFGFGVYQSPPGTCKISCLEALKVGYRHFDTAQYYGNEGEVGAAVRAFGIDRQEVFITTKVLLPSGSVEKTLERCRQSVREIGLGYVDLFLIHSPSSLSKGRREMWEALVELMNEGGTKAIGVSNYGVRHMEEITEYSEIRPAVNQIELHPWCQQRPIVEYCRQQGIAVQAYCPLVRGQFNQHPTLVALANKHSATPAQVLVRWSLQQGFIPLPKSDNPERIKENADAYRFELSREDMEQLSALDEGQKGALVPQNTECP